MRFWHKKKKGRNERAGRKVFGFLADPGLADGVRFLATVLESPIYPVAEHLIQIGAAHVIKNLEDEESRKQLHQHLVDDHLLVERLDSKERLLDSSTMDSSLNPQQEAVARAVMDLINRLERDHVPHDVVIEAVERIAARIERRRRAAQTELNAERLLDLETLRELDRRFPRLIPAVLELTAKLGPDGVARALSTSAQSSQTGEPGEEWG